MSSEVISFEKRQKRAKLEKLLEDRSVFLKLRVGTPGLVVPDEHATEEFLVLQVSHHFRTPLLIADDRLEQELVFGEQYNQCIIPYDAILLASSESGDYVEFVPLDHNGKPLADNALEGMQSEVGGQSSAETKNLKGRKAVEQNQKDAAERSTKKESRSFLKRVK